MGSTYDVFLVMHPFRDNVREFAILTRPLADLDDGQLAGVDGYYAPPLDTALIALRFDEGALRRLGERVVQLFASRSGLPMVVPPTLPPSARRYFFLEHLSRYTTYLQHYGPASPGHGIVEGMVRSLGEHVEELPATSASFDAYQELPIFGGGRRRRLGSVG